MAPRKAVVKPHITLEPKKGVRKKTPTVKSIGAKLKTVPTADLLISNEDNVDSEIVPKKITKRKLPNKVNINGIKTVKACKVNTEESYSPENASTKNKRAKLNKQNHNNHSNEATGELQNAETVFPKNKRTRACKQSQNHLKMDDNKAIEGTLNSEPVPMKGNNVKVSKIKKQKKSEIKIMLVDEDKTHMQYFTDESNGPEETPSKVKKIKAKNKEKQKKNKLIITKEDDIQANADEVRNAGKDVPPKIKKGKSACKQNNNDIKIMLANEVIRSAFEKKQMIVKNLNRPLATVAMKRPARPGRIKTTNKQNNNVENANNELKTLLDGHELIQDVAKKKPVKYAHCRKKSTPVPPEEVPQQLADVTSPSLEVTPKKKKILSLKRQTKSAIDVTSQNSHTVTEGKEETKESQAVDNNNTLFNSNLLSTAPDSTSEIGCRTESPKPNDNTCRRNSGTSTSTYFSWTKDISSSSTITSVTVKSSDFVRINKRLPIVKLTNLGPQFKRQNSVDSIFDENSRDTPFNEVSKCASECSSVSMTNLNVPQTLNLSTSSLTSVTSHRISENNRVDKEKKDRIIKLEQSLENLFVKIKNFDLEIINWIGYSKENKDSNIDNLHARIFEVLNDENDVIKYCKEINRVLVGNQETTERSQEDRKGIETALSEEVVENLVDNNSPINEFNSEEQNKYVLDTNLKSKKGTENKNIPDSDKEFTESKTFDKNSDDPDNDDDDALSLFAESITGLESSRKNSSFAMSVSNDKSITLSDLDETLRKNGRVIEPITYFDQKESVSCQIVNNVKKQTADSSTAFNILSDSDKHLNNKFKIDNRTGVNNSFSDTRKGEDVGVSYKDLQNINDTAESSELNRSLLSDTQPCANIQTRSSNDASEYCRSEDFETYRAGAMPFSLDNNNFNLSEDVSVIPVSTSENWNNRTRLVRDNTKAESENSNLASGEQMQQSAAIQLAMASKHKHFALSNIFKGMCLFNLVMTCKKINCNFPHLHIDVDFVRNKLQGMNEELFIKESMFLLKWSMLKRKYGMCFVEECIRRNMTIWLLHLVKEFISKGKKNREEAFDITVCETTLLHLNDADIQPSADILRSKIKPNICMCDHLMKAISETQNFARFKNVFIKLTLFMCQNGRSFRFDVVTQLVERLCILPYDDALARALLKVIAKTNPSIFNVPMMLLLERKLLKNNALLYKELIGLKQQAERYSRIASPPTQSPCIVSSNAYQTSTPIARADSPDTTNTDFVIKTTEPVITRTITISRTINTSNLNISTGSESSEERRYEPRRPQASWRSHPSLMSLRPQRQVYRRGGHTPRRYGGGLPKFLRRPLQNPY